MSVDPNTALHIDRDTSSIEAKADVPKLVSHVLSLRRDRGDRAALRRGRRPESRAAAIPLVGHYLVGGSQNNDSVFLFSALCASFPSVVHRPGLRLGQALRRGDPDRGDSDGSVARRIFALQRQPLGVGDSTVRSLLTITEAPAVGWDDVYWLYGFWDHPERKMRVARRQQLLEQFYRWTEPRPSDTDDNPTTSSQRKQTKL